MYETNTIDTDPHTTTTVNAIDFGYQYFAEYETLLIRGVGAAILDVANEYWLFDMIDGRQLSALHISNFKSIEDLAAWLAAMSFN